MKSFKRTLIFSLMGLGLIGSLQAQVVYEGPPKKLVEFSHKSPTTVQYHDRVAFYDSVPFDGISVKPSKTVGGGNIFMVENWKEVSDEAREREYEVVKELGKHFTLKHNFLILYGASQLD